jgi:hypothetical protein
MIFAYPTADEIAARAYELFVSGGRRVARLPEYWRKAETELLERAVERRRRENQPSREPRDA